MPKIQAEALPATGPDPVKAFENLLDRLVLYLSLFGIPAVLVAISRAIEFGWRWGLSMQVAAWGFMVFLLPFRQRWPFWKRTYGFLLGLMVYSGAGVMTWGLSGQGFLLLFAGVVMATLVDGPRAGLAVTCIALAIAGVA